MQISTVGTTALNANRQAAAAAGVAAEPQRKCDPQQVEFKIVMEVQADASAMGRALRNAPGWSAGPCPSDCSHGSTWNDSGNTTYARITSPSMKLGTGAEEQIEKALSALQAAGARTGKTGAMRFYVRRDALDDKATNHLFKMHIQNEDILYRLGQHGGTGRELGHKINYCALVSRNGTNDRTAAQWASATSHHNNGLNASQAGQWEMRYFDSSLDAKAVTNSARLVAGMVAAAIDGRGSFTQAHAANNGAQVDRKRWSELMRAVADRQTAGVFEKAFRGGGGNLAKGLGDAEEAGLKQLRSQQYIFSAGQQVCKTDDALLDALDTSPTITVQTPLGQRLDVPADQLGNYALIESGQTSLLPQDIKARLDQATDLRTRGIELQSNGRALTPTEVAITPASAALTAVRGNESFALDNRFGLQALQSHESGQGTPVSSEAQTFQHDLPALTPQGWSVLDGGQPTAWSSRAVAAFARGTLQFEHDGKRTSNLTTQSQIDTEVKAPQMLATLDNTQRTDLGRLQSLLDSGKRATNIQNSTALPGALVPWQIANRGGLMVHGAQTRAGAVGVQVPSWNRLQEVLDLETRHERLSPTASALVGNMRSLNEKGVRFSVAAEKRKTARDINLASAFTEQLSTPKGVRAELPRWTFWNWMPRKNVTIRSNEDVAKLAAKFGA